MILNLAVALGIGLLIGAERERRKGEGPLRSPAGIRTFTVASLAGAISFIVGGDVLLSVATAGVIILTAIAYWRAHEDDPRTVLRNEVPAAQHRDGALLIPSFAVERAQELISDLVQLMSEGELPTIPIYVDLPLATKASRVFAKHAADLDAGEDLIRGLNSRNVHFTETVEHKALDRLRKFHMRVAFGTASRTGSGGTRRLSFSSVFRLRGRRPASFKTGRLRSGSKARSSKSARASVPLPDPVRELRSVRMTGVEARLKGIVDAAKIIMPAIDEMFELTATGSHLFEPSVPPRIDRQKVAQLDWHNVLMTYKLSHRELVGGTPSHTTNARAANHS